MDICIDHLKKNLASGKPKNDLQAAQFILADMATKIEASRLLTYQAARQFENKQRGCEKQSAMAKLHACRTAVEVCDESIQLLGGYGYMQAYDVERLLNFNHPGQAKKLSF